MNPVMIFFIALAVISVSFFLLTALTGAPYVPTLKPGLRRALRQLYRLSEKDLLIDLGAGDGVVLAEASKCGAKAIGIELNPILALITKWRFRKNPKVAIKCQNFYHYRFPEETTIIYAFAVSPHIEPIYQKIQEEATRLKKPLYFISNAFTIPHLKPKGKVSTFYLYKITPKSNQK